MREIQFKTIGTCARQIVIKLQGDTVVEVRFQGGCTGSLHAISLLARGRKAADLAQMLAGIQCQNGTSCPDQLAKALASNQ